ncbi:MAG: transposase family protein [Thermomicrobiales bacterium]
MTSSIRGIGHATRHPLPDILTISLCAVICGENIWMGVEKWAEIREDLQTGWLAHDTFGRAFARLELAQWRLPALDSGAAGDHGQLSHL